MGTRMSLVVLGIPGYLVLGDRGYHGYQDVPSCPPGYLVLGDRRYHGYQDVPSCPWYPRILSIGG